METLKWNPVKAARLEDLSPATQQTIANNIVQEYTLWRTQRRGIEEQWMAIDRQVYQYDPIYTPQQVMEQSGFQLQLPYGFGSKIKMPHAFVHREGIVSFIMRYLMENEYDFFDVVPMDGADEEKCSAVKQYLMWLFDSIDFEASFTPHVRSMVHYGFAIGPYEWYKETQPRWDRQPAIDPMTGQQAGYIDIEAQDVVYDAPKLSTLNIYHTVIDPSARNLKTCKLIFIKPKTPHEIMATEGYKGIDWDFAMGAEEFRTVPNPQPEIEKRIAQGDTNIAESNIYAGQKLVYEAWGDFVDGRTIYKNYVAEVINGKLVRFEPNPYNIPHKPFVIGGLLPEPGRVYPQPPLMSIVGLQASFSKILNNWIDHNDIHTEKPLMVQANTIVRSSKETKAKLPPMSKNAYWLVRDVNGAKRMDSGTPISGYDPTAILALLDQNMQNATGDNPLLSGGTPQKYMKTGVAMTTAEAGNSKMSMYAKAVENGHLIPILQMTIEFIKQNGAEPKTFKRLDSQEDLVFNPEMLLESFKFNMRGASYNMAKQMQINNSIQALQQFLQSPLFQPILNPVRIFLNVMNMIGYRNATEMLNPQAYMMSQMQIQEPTLFQKLLAMLTGQGAASGGNTTGGQTLANPGQLPAGNTAAAGGNNEALGQVSPFNPVQ